MNTGIVYLIQPAELVGTNRFKIGCSKKCNLSRCTTGYKNGSRYLCIMECFHPFILENKIKTYFKNKFKLVAGNEFFEGDEFHIVTSFILIINQHRISFNNNINENNNDDKINNIEKNIIMFIKNICLFTNNDQDFLLLKNIKNLFLKNFFQTNFCFKEFKNLLIKNMKSSINKRKKINGVDYRSVITGWKFK